MPPWTLAIRASSRLKKPYKVNAILASWALGGGWRLQARQYADITPLRKQLKDEAKVRRAAGPRGPAIATIQEDNNKWELTVGIEIHAQLNTERKLFSCTSLHGHGLS